MKAIKYIVLGTTFFLFFYALTPHLGFSYDWIYLFFLIGNALVVYMVYSVLKKGESSGRKFNEGHWYDDVKEPSSTISNKGD